MVSGLRREARRFCVLLERRWPHVLAVQFDQVITAVSLQRRLLALVIASGA
jgi:hypothetical protein